MIEIKDLNHTYTNENEKVLKNVNIVINKGERIALLGPSGSGKTTLLKCVNRLVEPTSGKVSIEGEDILKANTKEIRKIRKKIAIIFQEFNLIERETVLKNVLNGRLGHIGTFKSCFNRFEEKDYKIAEECLEDVGLLHKKNETVNNLSGGQKQRIAIARALAQEPKVILADEPVSSLDPKLIREILFLLQKVCKDKNITLITSLHFVELIKEHFPRMIGLVDGEILFDDKIPEKNKTDSDHDSLDSYQEQVIRSRLKQLGYIE